MSIDELVENLKYDRDNLCDEGGHPVLDTEIYDIAEWGWGLRTKPGGLYKGRDSQYPVQRQTMDELLSQGNAGADAFTLHCVLSAAHGHIPGKRFSLSFKGMKSAELISFSRDRFYAARKILLDLNLLQKIDGYTVGKQSQQFQLGSLSVDAD